MGKVKKHYSARKTDKVKLDIACGKNKKNGFTGVDIWKGADIVVDLKKFPWPFEDNSVDEIFCSHYIEHTPDLISFANELYRIMKPGAKAEIIAPYYSSIRAWQDPTHLRAISENTFLYFNKEWRTINKLDHYPITANFDFESSYILSPEWQGKATDEVEFAIKHYINVISDIRTILTKRVSFTGDVELLMKKAEDHWEEGNQDEAAIICSEIISSGVEAVEIYLMLAEYTYKSGSADEAVELFNKVISFDEDSVQAHMGLLRSLNKAGRQGDTLAHLKRIDIQNQELATLLKDLMSF